jgi:hypothetical protein
MAYETTPVPEAVAPKPDGFEPATPPQVNFLRSLLDERVTAPDGKARLLAALDKGTVSKRGASNYIKLLKERPKITRPVRSAREQAGEQFDVAAGRYALEDPDDELNPVKFYKVGIGKQGGQWAGFVFVDRYTGDDLYPVKGHARVAILKAIAEDPQTAAIRFGHERKHCSICGRGLTRYLSRKLGIGPVCGGRLEWLTDDVIADARAELEAEGIDPDANAQD